MRPLPVPSTTAEPAPSLAGLLDELRWRGLLHAATPGLAARLATGRPIAGYNGFDPTARSLHIGNLVPIFGLLHLQRRGGRPVVVVGGGTGLIGDPSGRTQERPLLDPDTLAENAAAIRRQLERFLDFEAGPGAALMVDNAEWLGRLSLIEFLRDVGKHFTVPYMLDKESVRSRLERGLSYTEFSYMLLQAYDFLHLYRVHGVELQMGGADQWGNITAGLELIRRVLGGGEEGSGRELAHGLCYPLLTLPSGEKFGKTAAGTSVWLDPALTSPFAFYQYWLNAADADTPTYLRFFTLFGRTEIDGLLEEGAARPEARIPQRTLARDLTTRVHGAEAARRAERMSAVAFSDEPVEDPELLEALWREADGFDVPAHLAAAPVAVFLAETGLVASRSEARRFVAGGGVTINGRRPTAHDEPVPAPLAGRYWRVGIGRRIRRTGRLVEPGS